MPAEEDPPLVTVLSRPWGSSVVPPDRLATAAYQLINSLAEGTTSETAYDTALVSWLRDPADRRKLAYPRSLGWLRRHQHADGSWGGRIATAHDRLISTLAAVVRLSEVPEDWARRAVLGGTAYLWQHAADWVDSPYETVAFELLVPRLLEEARARGLELPQAAFAPVIQLRDDKLRRIPDGYLYGEPTTLVHSLEFLGNDLDRTRVARLRSANGAYGNSPSATAFVADQINDPAAEDYLRRAMAVSLNGGACTVFPIEIFEKAWVLYNLGPSALAVPGAQAQLRYLYTYCGAGAVGMSREGLRSDSDDTGMALALLQRAGYDLGLAALDPFQQADCFSCFPYERNSSVGANAHVLEAFVSSPQGDRHGPAIRKILSYFRAKRVDGVYWYDKWHLSPFYATSQVVLAAREVDADLLAPTIRWLLETQRADGSWGWCEGTSEETAYAVQALLAAAPPQDHRVGAALAGGARYLTERFDDADYPELWIGKGLYTPFPIVRAAVIGALQRYVAAKAH